MQARALLGVVAIACGGNVTTSVSDSAGGGGTSAIDASSPVWNGLRVTIVDEKNQPIAGAIVVVDAPSGARTEKTTDALGVSTFPNVDAHTLVDITAFN